MLKVRFLRSAKCLKTIWNSSGQPDEITQKLVTKTTAPHSWYSHVVTIISNYAVVREGL